MGLEDGTPEKANQELADSQQSQRATAGSGIRFHLSSDSRADVGTVTCYSSTVNGCKFHGFEGTVKE
jgi:hypothetical protein